MNYRGIVPSGPEAGDPVVADGVKYRIRSLGAIGHGLEFANLREHFAPNRELAVYVDRLEWDKVAGVWRVKA